MHALFEFRDPSSQGMSHPTNSDLRSRVLPASFPDRTSAFLQTALSDLLRAPHLLRSADPGNNSDRVLTFIGNLT